MKINTHKYAQRGAKVPGSESSRERKFHTWNFRSRERMVLGAKSPVTHRKYTSAELALEKSSWKLLSQQSMTDKSRITGAKHELCCCCCCQHDQRLFNFKIGKVTCSGTSETRLVSRRLREVGYVRLRWLASTNARFYHRGVNRGLLKPCFNSIRGLHHRLVLSTAE